jgi:hypothetical protein
MVRFHLAPQTPLDCTNVGDPPDEENRTMLTQDRPAMPAWAKPWIDSFRLSLEADKKSPHTIYRYTDAVGSLAGWLAHHRADTRQASVPVSLDCVEHRCPVLVQIPEITFLCTGQTRMTCSFSSRAGKPQPRPGQAPVSPPRPVVVSHALGGD